MRRLVVLAVMSLAAVLAHPFSPRSTIEITMTFDGPVDPAHIRAARDGAIVDALDTFTPAMLAAIQPAHPGAAFADDVRSLADTGTAGQDARMADVDRMVRAVEVEQEAPGTVRIRVSSGQMLAGHTIASGVRDRLAASASSQHYRLTHTTEGQWGLAVAYVTLAASLAILLVKAITSLGKRRNKARRAS